MNNNDAYVQYVTTLVAHALRCIMLGPLVLDGVNYASRSVMSTSAELPSCDSWH